MRRLRGLDAAFLSFETPSSHMHVAQASVFDPTHVAGGYSFERLRQLVESRLGVLPPFRRRLVEVPLGLGTPAWIEDPAFDLENHLSRAALPAPGGADELAAFTADFVSRPLDRRQPLWEMQVVEGLEGGMVAGVTKVHHSAVDGISGAELTANLLDLEPEPGPIDAPGPEWRPDQLPSPRDLAGLALRSALSQPPAALAAARHVLGAAIGIRRRNRAQGATAPPLPFAAPATPLNTSVGPRRRVAFSQIDTEDVTAVREAFGATVNDVVLATCAGALRAYLCDLGRCPDEPLVAAVPISVRGADERGTMGNRLSAMLVGLGTQIEDPVARLIAICEGSRQAKAQNRLIAPTTLSELAELVLPAVGRPMARLVSRLGLTYRPRPAFNVIISSFPGPPCPLYCAGARLVAPYPLGPVFDGGALNITVQSYLDSLFVGFNADDRAVPEVSSIAGYLRDALGELAKVAA